MPGAVLSVENVLLSSLGETLLAFEHLFDTGFRGVSRAARSDVSNTGLIIHTNPQNEGKTARKP